MADERVTVYIDGSNLYHSLRDSMGRMEIDLEKFRNKLVGERRLVRTYYYNATLDQKREPEAYKNQQRFFDALRHIPYMEVRLGRLVYPPGAGSPPHEKGVDIKIATDMIVDATRELYDVAMLVSGDTDFADALQAIKNMGRHVEVVLFNASGSWRIREVADRIIPVDEQFLRDCWRK